MAGLRLSKIRKDYGDVTTLHGIDLVIGDGEFVVFVGPSECGKSPLLRAISGLEKINGGDLFIGEKHMNDVPPSQRGIAMVFQSYALYPHMTVFDNMAFGLKLAGVAKNKIHDMVMNAARILRIEPPLDRKPKQLSGGQRQRASIGRAIMRKPDVFLFDEPLSNLDASLRVQMRIELANLHRELGSTMIYVTHDQVEAMTLADRIVVLNAGRIEQIGTPLDLCHRPDNLFVAGFLGSPPMNFLAGAVCATGSGQTAVSVAAGAVVNAETSQVLPVGAPVTVGARSEHLAVSDCEGIPALIHEVEQLGDTSFIYANVENSAERLVVRADPERSWKIGQHVFLQIAPSRVHVFDQNGLACT